ncbi:hypothetical protein M8J76_006919 [Diaphorina citri]|nr:hypothetical protein M8J76_006919 [Diaphorina citri]
MVYLRVTLEGGSLSQCSSSSRGNHSSSGLSSSSISSSASKRPRKADKSLPLPENRSESAGGVASARKKKVLEEKVDNTGNRGAKCQKKIKSKPPSTKGSKPGAGGTLGPRKSSGKSFLSDSPQPSCSKSTPGERENKFRPTSHVDIDVTEYCPSSDSEHELHSINMEGFDMDFVQPESDCETFAEIVSNRAVDRLCGPIPASGLDLFSGYVFVVSHSNQGLDYGSDGNLSDQQYEALTSKFPFRRRRLEHQLTKGGGTVFPSLNLVPHEKLENTLLITDRPGTTCNFILALAMRVPVLHYYYVIQCCVTKTHIKKHRLPEMSSGYSLEEKCLLDRNLTSANILGEYLIVIAMSAKTQTVIFWEKVAILIDDPEDTPDEVLAQSYDRILPTWIIQSLIHAQARDFNAHPAYRKKYPAGIHPGMNVSETY